MVFLPTNKFTVIDYQMIPLAARMPKRTTVAIGVQLYCRFFITQIGLQYKE